MVASGGTFVGGGQVMAQVPQTTIYRLRNFSSFLNSNNSGDHRKEVEHLSPQFQQIACGSEHSFALTKDGELYSWGLNFKGQLGLGDFENRHEPSLVEGLLPLDSPILTGGSAASSS